MILKQYIPLFESFIEYNGKFGELYKLAPGTLKDKMDALKNVYQSPDHHPEPNVFAHIQTVTNRLWNAHKDINLALSGFFHDIGKGEPGITVKKDKDPVDVDGELRYFYSAHGHEAASAKIVDEYRDWIKQVGGDPDKVYTIVNNHMKIKHYPDDMKKKTSLDFEIENKEDLVDIMRFNFKDFGGTNV